MTVMLCGLAETWMISLLEMGLQLIVLPTTSFCTVNATPYWCFESSPQNQILCPSSMVETTVFKECLWSYCVNISQNKMNYDKAQIVWTGSRKHSKVRFLRDMNFCWNPGIFTVLGDNFSTDIQQISTINYDKKLELLVSYLVL